MKSCVGLVSVLVLSSVGLGNVDIMSVAQYPEVVYAGDTVYVDIGVVTDQAAPEEYFGVQIGFKYHAETFLQVDVGVVDEYYTKWTLEDDYACEGENHSDKLFRLVGDESDPPVADTKLGAVAYIELETSPHIPYGHKRIWFQTRPEDGTCGSWVFDEEYNDVTGVVEPYFDVLISNPDLGDVNGDGVTDFDDVFPMIRVIELWEEYGEPPTEYEWQNADCDYDGDVDFNDIPLFVSTLE